MIEVKNLTKYYGNKLALDDISFTVNEGEVLGFLGPNGAGKSTTMKIITCFLSQTVQIAQLSCTTGRLSAICRPSISLKIIILLQATSWITHIRIPAGLKL